MKPDNIFLVHHEGHVQPKLVDFGIVKMAEAGRQLGLTGAGMIMGSPDYLSPEQATGRADIDHQSDVWAFSVVLFEAIAGRVPFDATNYNALLRQIVENCPARLHEIAPVDEQLSAIVARGLAKQRQQRHRSMTELGQALAQWLFDRGVTQDICGTSLEAKCLRRDDHEAREAVGDVWLPEARSGVRAVLDPGTTEARPARNRRATSEAVQRGSRLPIVLSITAALLGAAAFAASSYSRSPSSQAAGLRIGTPAKNSEGTPAQPAATAQPESLAETIRLDRLPLEPAPAPTVGSPQQVRAIAAGSNRQRIARPPVRKPRPPRDLLSPY